MSHDFLAEVDAVEVCNLEESLSDILKIVSNDPKEALYAKSLEEQINFLVKLKNNISNDKLHYSSSFNKIHYFLEMCVALTYRFLNNIDEEELVKSSISYLKEFAVSLNNSALVSEELKDEEREAAIEMVSRVLEHIDNICEKLTRE